MPPFTRTPKPDATALYTVIESHVNDHRVFKEGDVVSGAEPAVAANFQFFLPLGSTTKQVQEAQGALREKLTTATLKAR